MKNLYLIIVCILLATGAARAQTSGTAGPLTWEKTGPAASQTLTISGTGAMPDYSGDAPWNNSVNITAVVIGEGVTHIGAYAFYTCTGLTSVTIPNSVETIGANAFRFCSKLTSVTIGSSVASIGTRAFDLCNALTEITNLAAAPQPINANVFSVNKANVTLRVPGASMDLYKAAAVWSGFTHIEALPPPTRGSTGALSWEVIDGTLTISGEGAMPDYGSGDAPWDDHRDDITGVVIGDGVTSIGESAFLYCGALASFAGGNSVTSIGQFAFYGCTGLTSFTLPDKVETIGISAFIYCTGLTEITIPASVTVVGDDAFAGCPALAAIEVDPENTAYASDGGVLFDKNKTRLICFPDAKTGAYAVPEGVTHIEENAFDDCEGLTSVTIPASVTGIGDYAFSYCTGLTSVTIPASVTGIGAGAFNYCTGLTEVTNRAAAPQAITEDVFNGVDLSGVVLTVPAAAAEAYRADEVWGAFSSIEAIAVPVTGVSLDPAALSLVVGDTESLTATVAPDDASNKAVTWESSDDNIVTIDASGAAGAVAPGTATITVTTEDGGKTAVCTVTVTQPVTGVSLDPTALSLVVGTSDTLTATVAPDNATNKAVTWISSNASVASVAGVPNGTAAITAHAPGTATITVTTEDGGKTATCAVTVTQPVTGVSLDPATLSLVVGDTESLTATVAPDDASNKAVIWKSSNDNIVTIDASGAAGAVAPGTATITVTTEDGGKTATCTVTVTAQEVPVTGVSLNKTALSLKVNEAETLTATVAPDNATNKAVTWKSSNESVATVAAGKVTAVAPGTATITVTTEDGGHTAGCTVTVESITAAPELAAPELKAYPNPFADMLHLTGAEGCTLRVINAAGTTVHTRNIESPDATIPLEHLPAGIYFLRLEKAGRTKTMRVMKN